MTQTQLIKWVTAGVVALLVLVTLVDSATIISSGEQGIVKRTGAIRPTTLSPGLHWVIPFIDSVTVVDVKEQKEQVAANAASRDLQSVATTVALNYHLDPAKANQLIQEVGVEYKERIISPSIQESVKAATAQFSVEELITKRQEVALKIRQTLTEKLARKYILLDDLSIVNFSFTEEFNKAIEAKQVSEQQTLKSRQDLERVKVEAEQKVAQANAEAAALRAQKSEITDQLIRLREVEAQIKAIDKWNGQLPTYTGSTVPFINLNK